MLDCNIALQFENLNNFPNLIIMRKFLETKIGIVYIILNKIQLRIWAIKDLVWKWKKKKKNGESVKASSMLKVTREAVK